MVQRLKLWGCDFHPISCVGCQRNLTHAHQPRADCHRSSSRAACSPLARCLPSGSMSNWIRWLVSAASLCSLYTTSEVYRTSQQKMSASLRAPVYK